MSDNLDSVKPPTRRREKPQTLEGIQATKSLSDSSNSDLSPNRSSELRLTRNRSRDAEIRSKRDHSSDGVLTTLTKDTKLDEDTCNEFDGNDSEQRRESFNCEESSSPSSHGSLTKSMLAKSLRLPSVPAGAATRKCVLTLDGYSYVIVASTPENLPKKDDLSYTPGSNNPNAGCHTQTVSGIGSSSSSSVGAANISQHFVSTSDKAFTNNQTAAGGGGNSIETAATIAQTEQSLSSGTSSSITAATAGGGGVNVKQDFSKITSPSGVDYTQDSNSNASIASSASNINGQVARHGALTIVRRSNSRKSINQNDSQHLYSPLASTPTTSSTTTYQTLLGDLVIKSLTAQDNRHNDPIQDTTLTPSHTTASSFSYKTTDISNSTTTAQTIKMLPTSPNSGNNAIIASDDNLREDSASSAASRITLSSTIDLATDNLPAVDTPDACDKAALRLRSLLRMLNTGEIQADVLQKNLHYAARVLEAVFLDETNRSSGKTRLRQQNPCSSVECEDQGNKHATNDEHCNGDEHTSVSNTNENNNVDNNTCSMLDNAENTDQANEDDKFQTENESKNQISIDSRTKGVCSAPHTHSGPTGPPVENDDIQPNQEQQEIEEVAETHKQTNDNKTCESTKQPEATTSTENVDNSSVSSSSCSNKATIKRQKQILNPDWARTMSTTKTYISKKIFFFL